MLSESVITQGAGDLLIGGSDRANGIKIAEK